MSRRRSGSVSEGATEVRHRAVEILGAVERGGYADRFLEAKGTGLDERDRNLLQELVYGTLRRRGELDYYLDHLLAEGLDSVHPWTRAVLRVGAYQLLGMGGIPPYAAVDQAVRLAKQRGRRGDHRVVNGVLRNLVRRRGEVPLPDRIEDPVGYLSVVHSHPRWLVERWVRRWGEEETEALLEASNRRAPIGLRINPLRGQVEEILASLKAQGVQARPSPWHGLIIEVEGLPPVKAISAFREGRCSVQDPAASLVGLLARPEPGWRVADLCAAPGGKATHLAEQMEDRGVVVAVDRSLGRLRLVAEAARRLGLESLRLVCGDGSALWLRGIQIVLVDVPCTGTGVFRRRLDARWQKTPRDLEELPSLQAALLRRAVEVVGPGGLVVYATCSLEPEENWGVVEAILAERNDLKVEPAAEWVPREVVDERGALVTLPHRHGTDGAFAVRLRRLR